jgi:hypothetical protein
LGNADLSADLGSARSSGRMCPQHSLPTPVLVLVYAAFSY